MSVQVQGPDGATYQFPDGTDKAAAIAYFKKKGIGAQTPPVATGDWRDVLTRSEPHQSVHSASDLGREVERGVGNIGAGGLGVVLRPVSTAVGIGESIVHPINTATNLAKQLKEHPLETIEAGIGQAGATAGLGEVGEATARGVGKVIPRTAEAVTKTGPRETANLVKETRRSNATDATVAREANIKAAQEHLEKTQEALHKTEGEELKHREDTAQAKVAAEAETKVNLKKHLQSRESAIRERAEAEQKLIAEKAAQGKIAPTQAKLQTAWSNLRAGVETAREKALKVGNEKYSAVNEKLNILPADMESIQNLYADASGVLGETQAVPSLLTRLGKSIEHGDELTYKDEQALYSELGKELSKGTLPGPTYHAFDVLHEGIGNDMQRIADSQGQGAELLAARNYWRRMKQTFGKPLAMNDAASKALKGSASGLAAEDSAANQIRLLGSFDPDIPKMFNHIGNIEKGVDALPKPTSAREVEQGTKAPTIPPRKPILPKVEASPIAPPERVAPPDRPTEVQPDLKTIGAGDIRAAKEKGLEHRVNRIRSRGEWIGTGVAGYRVLANILHGNLGAVPADLLEGGIAVGGVEGISRLLENPKVVEFLTRPTARDVAQVPLELRGDMSQIAQVAARKGIKVDPRLYAVAGAIQPKKGVASALGSDRSKYKHIATNKKGHRIGSNDGSTWVDTQTGAPVNAQ